MVFKEFLTILTLSTTIIEASIIKTIYADRYVKPDKTDIFDHSFYFRRQNKDNRQRSEIFKDADKVKIARQVCSTDHSIDRLGLKEHLEQIVEMIRHANK